jgi:leader peptidase (prepilin peptidase)/N-methyltransferase
MPLPLLMTGALLTFLYGIVVGSFLNVCIYRLPVGESLLTPPSHCPACQTRLRARDLVPLGSYLALRGRCRYCRTRISPRYFIIEFVTGLLFVAFWVALAARFSDVLWAPTGLAMLVCTLTWVATMLVTFMIDLDTTYVIEPVTWLGMGAGLVFELIDKWVNFQPVAFQLGPLTIPYLPAAVPGMIVGFLVFIALDLLGRLLFRKPSMGLGDAFIGAAIGAMLGPAAALLSFLLAIGLGAVVGSILLLTGALQSTKAPAPVVESDGPMQEVDEELPEGRYMPFGPFLTASATLIALAPEWSVTLATNFWHWWLYQNPFIS